MFDKERQIFYLIEELKTMGIQSPIVLQAIQQIPRENFVPETLRRFAYKNAPLAIGKEQTISQPYMVARMTELLEIVPGLKALEIGTGSGYQAAVLAYLGAEVHTLERIETLFQSAKDRLDKMNFNIRCYYRDGNEGLPAEAPFQRILVTAACPQYPIQLEQQLEKANGILVCPVGAPGGVQQLVIVRFKNNVRSESAGCYCQFVPLKNNLQPEAK